jgi:hypothetical protein
LPDPWQHWPFRGVRSYRGVRGPNAHRVTPVKLRACLKWVGLGAPAPVRESRLQPVPATHRLKPGLLGRCPVSQGTQHTV